MTLTSVSLPFCSACNHSEVGALSGLKNNEQAFAPDRTLSKEALSEPQKPDYGRHLMQNATKLLRRLRGTSSLGPK